MKNTISLLTISLLLAGCSTPQMVMKNPHTSQVQVCGGNTTASITGGAIGYHYQLKDDEKCVETFKKQGFKAIDISDDESENDDQ